MFQKQIFFIKLGYVSYIYVCEFHIVKLINYIVFWLPAKVFISFMQQIVYFNTRILFNTRIKMLNLGMSALFN